MRTPQPHSSCTAGHPLRLYRDVSRFSNCEPSTKPYMSPLHPLVVIRPFSFPGGLAEARPYSGVLSPAVVARALQEALQQYAGCGSGPPVVYPSKWPETEVVVGVLENRIRGIGMSEYYGTDLITFGLYHSLLY